jgi:hypothetical protein
VAVVVAALIGGVVAYLTLAGSPDWYATGKSVELASEQQDDGFLVGPVSTLPTACTVKMNAAESGQRPASTDKAAVKLWLQGGEAAYHRIATPRALTGSRTSDLFLGPGVRGRVQHPAGERRSRAAGRAAAARSG